MVCRGSVQLNPGFVPLAPEVAPEEEEAALQRVRSKLEAAGAKQDVSFITRQKGMFSYTGLTADQAERLKTECGVYILRSGRMCVAGLNTRNVEATAEAMAAVLGA